MGRFSDALQKIEEERLKKNLFRPKDRSVERVRQFKNYGIGLLVISVITLIAVYAYGVRTGSRVQKMNTNEPQTSAVGAPSLSTSKPVSSVLEIAQTDENRMLLESVERMVEHPVEAEPEAPVVLAPQAQESLPVPGTQGSEQHDFYTLQIASYEDEASARSQAEVLLSKGYRPIILRGSQSYTLCVGKFTERLPAEEKLSALKSSLADLGFSDVYIRFAKRKS